MNGCSIAVTTISADASLLHADVDFDVLAAHAGLEAHPIEE